MGNGVNLLLLATMGTSTLSIPFDYNISNMKYEINYLNTFQPQELTETLFTAPSEYNSTMSNIEDIKEIINFSRKLITRSTDLESKYSDVVDKHFWDLI